MRSSIGEFDMLEITIYAIYDTRHFAFESRHGVSCHGCRWFCVVCLYFSSVMQYYLDFSGERVEKS